MDTSTTNNENKNNNRNTRQLFNVASIVRIVVAGIVVHKYIIM